MATTTPITVIRIAEACRRLGISRPTIYRWVRDGRLPRLRKLGTHSSCFIESEFDEAVAKLIQGDSA